MNSTDTLAARSPAPFSTPILERLSAIVIDWEGPILDPYAGNCLIHTLGRDDTWATEIEPEFCAVSPEPDRTFCADSRFVPVLIESGRIPRPKAIVTSPDYGNRMADQYLGTPAEVAARAETGRLPRRRSYAISLNRRVSEGSGAGHQFGPEYCRIHEAVMSSVTSVLEPGARLALNVSNHYRGGELVHVFPWWVTLIARLGWRVDAIVPVETRRFRDGENSDLRDESEYVIIATLTTQTEET